MQRLLIIGAVLLVVMASLQAQVYYEEESPVQESGKVNENSLSHLSFGERSYFGGNLALSFGRNTYIDVSPLWGYMVNRRLSVGAGATYIYLSREFINPASSQTFDVNSSLYGGRGFLRYQVFDQYYFHSEFESINNEVPRIDGSGQLTRDWVPGLLIGAGIFQPFFGRGGGSLFILYNVIHDDIRSPYGSPWVIRAGFTL